MKNLKRLVAGMTMMLVLGISAFAGDIQSPPCAQPVPGQIETPPCDGGQVVSDPATPGIIQGPPAANASEYSLAEVALTLLEGLLLY